MDAGGLGAEIRSTARAAPSPAADDGERGRHMLRSVVAVVSGYLAFLVLTYSLWMVFGQDLETPPTEGFLVLSLAFETPFAVAAGYLTAWIARRRGAAHAAVLAGAMALHGAAGLVASSQAYPVWVDLVTLFILAPCCYVGGRIREFHQRSRLETQDAPS